MWYLIADANNGLTSNDALTAGVSLTIPNKVTNVHNNSGTFKPYNPGEAMEDTSPTLPVAPSPPKKKGGCGGMGMIIVAVVAVVATVVTQQYQLLPTIITLTYKVILLFMITNFQLIHP